MRYEDAVTIEELARTVFEKREAYQALAMSNVTAETFVRFELAKAELRAAEGRLLEAQGQMSVYGKLRPSRRV